MKTRFLHFVTFLAVLLMAFLATTQHGLATGLTLAVAGTASVHTLFQRHALQGRICVTLITPILTGNVAEAFRTKVPELSYFSTDFGKTGGIFAAPVKFGSEVISHLSLAPTASAYNPGDGLGTGATNVKDLITDITVKIDQAAIVNIKLPTVDSVKYLLEPAFKAAMMEAGKSLGRFVIGKVVEKFNRNTFSYELVGTVAGAEKATLTAARAKLNKQGALAPRFILGETDWIKNLAEDPVIQSGQFYDQRTGADPYITLVNIDGFESVREFPNMPTNTVAVGAATVANAGDLLTLNAHGLSNDTRVRLTGTMPTGLSLATDYYVSGATTNTFQLAASPGGAAVAIGADGTVTVSKFEGVNAFAGEKRAIHIAFRPLLDNQAVADMLGIPKTMNILQGVEPESGLAFTWFLWQDGNGTNPTGDIYAACVVAFGIRGGREITSATAPGQQAAGSGMDKAGLRIVESAAS